MIETTECWYCHKPSVRPLCAICVKSSKAQHYVKCAINRGATTAPNQRGKRPVVRGFESSIRQNSRDHIGKDRTVERMGF